MSASTSIWSGSAATGTGEVARREVTIGPAFFTRCASPRRAWPVAYPGAKTGAVARRQAKAAVRIRGGRAVVHCNRAASGVMPQPVYHPKPSREGIRGFGPPGRIRTGNDDVLFRSNVSPVLAPRAPVLALGPEQGQRDVPQIRPGAERRRGHGRPGGTSGAQQPGSLRRADRADRR